MKNVDPVEQAIKDDQQDLLKIAQEVAKKLSHQTRSQEFKALLNLSNFNFDKASSKEVKEAEIIFNFKYISNEKPEFFYTAVAIGGLLLTFRVLLAQRKRNFIANLSAIKISIKENGKEIKQIPMDYIIHSVKEDAFVKESVACEIWESFIQVLSEKPDILSNQDFKVVKNLDNTIDLSLSY